MIMVLGLKYSVAVLGPDFDKADSFFHVIDEAQVAGKTYENAFADETGENKRPLLRPLIQKMLEEQSTHSNIEVIISVRSFSPELFKPNMPSDVGKDPFKWNIVHTTGDFSDQQIQLSYISRYLPPSVLSSESGIHLATRMYDWLRGRYVVAKVAVR